MLSEYILHFALTIFQYTANDEQITIYQLADAHFHPCRASHVSRARFAQSSCGAQTFHQYRIIILCWLQTEVIHQIAGNRYIHKYILILILIYFC
jgi:hypothetical protein